MKIKTKLLLGLSTLPIVILLLIGIAWLQLVSLNNMNEITKENYELSYLTEEIHREVKNEAISLRNIIIFEDGNSIQSELLKLEQQNDFVTERIALLEANANSSQQVTMIETLKNTNREFNEYKDKLINFTSEGKKAEAITLINSQGPAIHEDFFQVISELSDHLEKEMTDSFDKTSQDYLRQILIGSILSILVIIVIVGFLFRTIWSMTKRLTAVSNVMKNVANGKVDLSTKVVSSINDEIGDVAKAFNSMAESLEVQRNREQSLIWSKSNIADITTSLSGNHDLETLSKTFLSKVVPLVDVCHAVFYIKDEETVKNNKPIYKLLSSYAFKERKHATTTFSAGEGLIGQVVIEKTPIILTNVPVDHVQIKSGLGESSPLNLYVIPIIFEGDVKAVIELASFKPFNKTQQNFLEELIDGFGVILDSVLGRIKLAHLLEESQTLMEEVQAQSEELQAQQEELKAMNEELEEQTVALRQSEEKLQLQQEELEQTNAELKEKAKSLKEQNRNFEQTNKEVEFARAELEKKAIELTLSSKYKSEFLANMSHELRTPLNSLLILSKLLSDNLDGNLTDKQVEFATTIYSSGSDLLTLINDILDLAKIESGKMEVNPSNVHFEDIADFIESNFRQIANQKNLHFHILLNENLPSFIYTDELRLKQLLKNLLSNAFKFTHSGEIKLEMSFNQATFSFAVIDSGIGIPKEKQELIFQAFQQADGTTSRQYGGTGLGLSICKEIANLLDGKIIVNSEEGKGSKFTLILGNYQNQTSVWSKDEVAVARDTVVIEESREEHTRSFLQETFNKSSEKKSDIKRLLIVDNDISQRNSLMEHIGDKNVIIKAVSKGSEAIEELKVNQFDCLILDLALTDTTGFELLENIKSNESINDITVFIYTGRILSSKEEMYLNKYANTIIIKDEHAPQRLKEELDLYLNGNSQETAEAIRPNWELSENKKFTGLEGKKILLVDDDVRNVFALSTILELYGMKITFAENGRESLELLKLDSNIDLVLMDIMMPEMDGYEAIQRIREIPQFHSLPIIALTAKAMKEDRQKCIDTGASDYITKPVNPDQLISLISVWLYQ